MRIKKNPSSSTYCGCNIDAKMPFKTMSRILKNGLFDVLIILKIIGKRENWQCKRKISWESIFTTPSCFSRESCAPGVHPFPWHPGWSRLNPGPGRIRGHPYPQDQVSAVSPQQTPIRLPHYINSPITQEYILIIFSGKKSH